MKKLHRDNVFKIQQPEPGKPIEHLWREFGIEGDPYTLAFNENLWGASPMAVQAVEKTLSEGNFYPDNSCYELREKLGKLLDLPITSIQIGNGSSDLIYQACVSVLNPEDNIVMSECSFIVAKLVSQVIGCHAKEVPLDDYHHDLDNILAAIDINTKIIYLDLPMNPIGTSLTREKFDRFMERLPKDVLLICDEAYHEYAEQENIPETLSYVRKGRHILVLRTFSKLYGLAGFRIGYCLAGEEMIDVLKRIRLPFAVNKFAQIGAVAALDDRDHVKKTLTATAMGKKFLYEEFQKMSIFYIPSETNFVTIDVKKDGREICALLQRKGVIVRSLAGYGKPTFLRITIGTMAQNKKFVEELRAIVGGRS